MKKISAFASLTLLLILSACGEDTQQAGGPPPGPMPVDVAQPVKKVITDWDDYTGRFEAVDRVEVRARVTGYLTEKRFKDGELVKKGDVLFVIDPRSFEFQLAEAQAQFTLASKALRRAENLRKRQALSQEELDRRFQEYRVAEAQLNAAKLDVEFTQVKAPINGRVSEGFVDIGNLVQENQTLMTRIVSQDPIHFEFEASQTQLLKYIRLNQSGKRPGSRSAANPIFVKLQDEQRYEHAGRMDFVDNIVDPGTGTILGRAVLPNRDGVLIPGVFGRARLIGSGPYEAVLIPERTVQTDQNRKFVYVVNAQNQAGRAYITVGPMLDNGFVPVRDGLTGEERIIVAGVQRIRAPNQPVAPNEVSMNWTDIETLPSVDTVPSLDDIMAGGENGVE